MDVIIPVKSELIRLVVERTIPSVIRYIPFSRLIIITRKENFEAFLKIGSVEIQLIDEDAVVEGLTFKTISSLLKQRIGCADRAGWYFQQFLKLGIAFKPDISNRYLVWDADAVALRPLHFISEGNKVLITKSLEYHLPYFQTIHSLLGITKQVGYSFISEHMVFSKAYVQEMIDRLSKADGNFWWVTIINAIDTNELAHSGFSEYETYGNFVMRYHPDEFLLTERFKTRDGMYYLGSLPSRRGLWLFSLIFDYISIEGNQQMIRKQRHFAALKFSVRSFIEKSIRFLPSNSLCYRLGTYIARGEWRSHPFLLSRRAIFSEVYKKQIWGRSSSHSPFYSGDGSEDENTMAYSRVIRDFVAQNGITSLVDLGCGDFRVAKHFLQETNVKYIGVDVVPALIAYNQMHFSSDSVGFRCLDIVRDSLPKGDLCLVRQVFQHLSNSDIQTVLKKCKDFKYVIVTEHLPSYRDIVPNIDKATNHAVRLAFNSGVYLDKPPFNLTTRQLLSVIPKSDPSTRIVTFQVSFTSL